MSYESLNDMMVAPLQQLFDLPQVVQMTIRLKPGMSEGQTWDCDISVTRHHDPIRFIAEPTPADGEPKEGVEFDMPVQAFGSPQDAFWAAVAYICNQIMGDRVKPRFPA